MSLRWLTKTIALPLAYIVVLYVATRPPKPIYVFANPTAMTVTDKGGPPAMHAPAAVYPRPALHARVEGNVMLKVRIAADGMVKQADAISGPEPLREAAVDKVRAWQFEAREQETQIDVGFSLRSATHSLVLPEAVHRNAPVYRVTAPRFGPRGSDGGPTGPRRVRATGDGTRAAGACRGGIGPPVDLPGRRRATANRSAAPR